MKNLFGAGATAFLTCLDMAVKSEVEKWPDEEEKPFADSKNELTLVPQSECVKLGAFQIDTWESITVNGTEIDRGSIVMK